MNATGMVESRNYPNNYPNNEKCLWLLTAPKKHRIQLTIVDMDIEAGGKICEYDSLKV